MSITVLANAVSAFLLAAILIVAVSSAPLDDSDLKRGSMPTLSNRVIAQFLDRLPAYNMPVQRLQRRFDFPLQSSYENEVTTLRKRNNAEVVNHILKNFGNLDRLGDVGR